jgi:hypothetical protein
MNLAGTLEDVAKAITDTLPVPAVEVVADGLNRWLCEQARVSLEWRRHGEGYSARGRFWGRARLRLTKNANNLKSLLRLFS